MSRWCEISVNVFSIPWPTSLTGQSRCWHSPLRTVPPHKVPESRICRRCSSSWGQPRWSGRCLFLWTSPLRPGCPGFCQGEILTPVSWKVQRDHLILVTASLFPHDESYSSFGAVSNRLPGRDIRRVGLDDILSDQNSNENIKNEPEDKMFGSSLFQSVYGWRTYQLPWQKS